MAPTFSPTAPPTTHAEGMWHTVTTGTAIRHIGIAAFLLCVVYLVNYLWCQNDTLDADTKNDIEWSLDEEPEEGNLTPKPIDLAAVDGKRKFSFVSSPRMAP